MATPEERHTANPQSEIHVDIVLSDQGQTERDRIAAIEVLRSFLNDEACEQRSTLDYLASVLDEDRPADLKRFEE